MTRSFTLGLAFATATALVAFAPAAHAASPQQVNNWNGGGSFPSDVKMYVYVPNNVAAKPPVVALIHYCGGDAPAVFGQAQGGGLVAAADKHGFIMVIPSSGRCWDVTSKKAQTRDGGGDTHAIAQMVKYALTQYHGNPDRVYATGDSSGGMTTQLLLALYPDVFKGGASFAGVPAGCADAFDASGLCGRGNQTAQQWGDRVRAMAPNYDGHRPRVQLFHGDADQTIKFPNHGEAIKEWTNVLGLPSSPTSTETGLSLGSHKATRQRWKNQCGFVVLEAITSQGGDHGPSDALFKADYMVPFLGLDDTGDVDPEIKQCNGGGGGSGGAGGAAGGSVGAGGARAGAGGVGGNDASGGRGDTGGRAGLGGSANQGGSPGSGGSSAGGVSAGGAPGMGGATGLGGSTGTGGVTASNGGNGASSGGSGNGGSSPSTSSGGSASGGAAAQAGAAGGSAGDDAGCSCRVGSSRPARGSLLLASLLGLAFGWRRRRKQP